MDDLPAIFARYHAQGLFSHAVAAFGGLASGREAQVLAATLPEERDVFDLASLTKALVTTPLVFREVAHAGRKLTARVDEWLGAALAADLDPALRSLRILDLLRHESGLPAWRNWWVCHLGLEPIEALGQSPERERRLVEGLNRAAPAIRADRHQLYSDVGFLLLGLVLERLHGADLASQFDSLCQHELGLVAADLPLQYAGHLDCADRFVPTAFCPSRERILRGEVHDENCASLGGVTGHAGLFGSAEAVGRFLSALYQSPTGQALWAANREAVKRPAGEPPNEPLVGWRQGGDRSAATFRNGLGMGHLGFTGVAFWVCPDRNEYAMLLTNRVCSGRIRPEIVSMRREVFAALNPLEA